MEKLKINDFYEKVKNPTTEVEKTTKFGKARHNIVPQKDRLLDDEEKQFEKKTKSVVF